MKTLILGMGNPILSDDGVGLHVARALEGKFPWAEVRTTSMIGLHLLDLLAGRDRVFLIDAIQTGNVPPGTVVKSKNGEGALHLFSTHGFHFFEILRLGEDLGLKPPEVGEIYGIEIGDGCDFGEGLTPLLRAKKEEIVRVISEDLQRRVASGE